MVSNSSLSKHKVYSINYERKDQISCLLHDKNLTWQLFVNNINIREGYNIKMVILGFMFLRSPSGKLPEVIKKSHIKTRIIVMAEHCIYLQNCHQYFILVNPLTSGNSLRSTSWPWPFFSYLYVLDIFGMKEFTRYINKLLNMLKFLLL